VKKKLTTVLILTCLCLSFFASVAYADVWVNGYFRSDGTYVSGYYRSDPDGSFYNNWSYSGNTNPYTRAIGTKSYSPIYPSYQGYYDYDWSYSPSYSYSYSYDYSWDYNY